MSSRFHQEALGRLSVQHVLDPAALGSLKERATKLGITLPASFVEWYGMRDGIELLKRNSNGDEPIEIERLGDHFEWRGEIRDWLREGLLLFMFENQAVCVWALRLDGGDDPPVVVARDPDLEWRPCVERFSTFIACQVWDHAEIWDEAGARILLQAQAVPLKDADLAFLRKRFDQVPTTHEPLQLALCLRLDVEPSRHRDASLASMRSKTSSAGRPFDSPARTRAARRSISSL